MAFATTWWSCRSGVFGDDAHFTDADVLAALRQLERLNFDPGTEYLYSNSGYWLLAELIPRVSGLTLRQFAGEHLFGPVGMTGSHFHDRHREIVPGRATGYRPRPEAEGGGFEVDMTTLEMVGDGGLYTSVNELRHWERMFLDPAALGPDLLRRLTAPGRFNDGSAQDYAGGLGLGEYRGLATVSHGGSFVGFRTYALRFPEQAFAVFVLCNSASADPGALSRRVADLFLADEMAPARDTARAGTREALPIRPGRFWEAASASLASIERKDEGPVLVRGGGETALSIVGGELSGFAGDTRLRLEPRAEGFVLHQPGQRAFRYVRVEGYPRDEEQPALADMVELAGAYRCRELDVSYEVRLGRPSRAHPGGRERGAAPRAGVRGPGGTFPGLRLGPRDGPVPPRPGGSPRPGIRALGRPGPGIPVRPGMNGLPSAGSMKVTSSRQPGPSQRDGALH